MWTVLQDLKAQSDLPWCVLGDFNEAMWSFKHFSAMRRSEAQMRAFREVLEVCELVDLGFSGLPYTYDNKRHGNRNMKVWLDRVVADNNWRDIFSEARVVHQVSPCSDHCPIMLRCEKEEVQNRKPRQKQYEIMWEREASLPERIQNAWCRAGSKHNLGGDIHCGLSALMDELQVWSKKSFGSVACELEKSRTQLEELMAMNAYRKEIRRVEDRMNEMLYREELMWL